MSMGVCNTRSAYTGRAETVTVDQPCQDEVELASDTDGVEKPTSAHGHTQSPKVQGHLNACNSERLLKRKLAYLPSKLIRIFCSPNLTIASSPSFKNQRLSEISGQSMTLSI